MSAPVLDAEPRGLSPLLRMATVMALVAAVAGTFTSGRWSSAFGGLAVGVIVVAPLLRVAIFGIRWARLGDRRYAAAAFGLLLVTAAGAALALL